MISGFLRKRVTTAVWLTIALMGLILSPSNTHQAQAFTEASRYELGLRYGYGQTCKAHESLTFNSFYPRWGVFLTDTNNTILGKWRLALVLEGVVGTITDHNRGWEIGVTPLLKLSYPFGRVLGYLEGGAGLVWEDIDSPAYAHRFNFSPQVGVGFDINLFGGYALSLAYRFRHTSNAGLYKENPGVNSNFFLIGIMYYY